MRVILCWSVFVAADEVATLIWLAIMNKKGRNMIKQWKDGNSVCWGWEAEWQRPLDTPETRQTRWEFCVRVIFFLFFLQMYLCHSLTLVYVNHTTNVFVCVTIWKSWLHQCLKRETLAGYMNIVMILKMFLPWFGLGLGLRVGLILPGLGPVLVLVRSGLGLGLVSR